MRRALVALAILLTGCNGFRAAPDDEELVRGVYARYRAAVTTGDLATFREVMEYEIDPSIDATAAAGYLAELAARYPKDRTITGVTVRTSQATITLTAPIGGGTADGTVDLWKKRGVWKVGTETWNVQLGNAVTPAREIDRVPRPPNFHAIRGTWGGAEIGGTRHWTFSFSDDYGVLARADDHAYYRGHATMRPELGKDGDGAIRTPPGATLLDVEILESSDAESVGKIAPGAYGRQGDEVKLCVGAPGDVRRAERFDESAFGIRCFALTLVSPDA